MHPIPCQHFCASLYISLNSVDAPSVYIGHQIYKYIYPARACEGMDVLFHFLFTLLALYAARVHVRNHHLAPLIFAFAATLPDFDHFFGMMPRATLHNVFVTILFPLALVALAFKYEKYGVYWKQMSILFFLVLASHSFLDFFTSYSVMYFYPFSTQPVDLTGFNIQVNAAGKDYPLMSSASAGVLIYMVIL